MFDGGRIFMAGKARSRTVGMRKVAKLLFRGEKAYGYALCRSCRLHLARRVVFQRRLWLPLQLFVELWLSIKQASTGGSRTGCSVSSKSSIISGNPRIKTRSTICVWPFGDAVQWPR